MYSVMNVCFGAFLQDPGDVMFILFIVVFLAAVITLSFKSRIHSIAGNTFKETVRQPVFYVLLGIGGALIIFSGIMPMFAMGEDELPMIKDMGFATIVLAGLLIAFFSASTAISDEIDKKTALTVLSKPVGRGEFIIGKYFGILIAVLLAIVILGVILFGTVAVKQWYPVIASSIQGQQMMGQNELLEASVRSRAEVAAADTRESAVQLVKGLFASFLQLMVLTGISVAVATRLPMIVNIAIGFAFFVLGHVSEWIYTQITLLAKSSVVQAIGTFFYTIIPNLENVNITWQLSQGTPISSIYLLLAFIYSLIFSSIAIYIAFISMRRREIA